MVSAWQGQSEVDQLGMSKQPSLQPAVALDMFLFWLDFEMLHFECTVLSRHPCLCPCFLTW